MISKYFAKLVMLAERRCAHEFEFVRNIHGDEIIRRNYKRSLWSCKKCGRDEFRDELFKPQ